MSNYQKCGGILQSSPPVTSDATLQSYLPTSDQTSTDLAAVMAGTGPPGLSPARPKGWRPKMFRGLDYAYNRF